jgi:LPXTG-motif cell wall-anchored protein
LKKATRAAVVIALAASPMFVFGPSAVATSETCVPSDAVPAVTAEVQVLVTPAVPAVPGTPAVPAVPGTPRELEKWDWKNGLDRQYKVEANVGNPHKGEWEPFNGNLGWFPANAILNKPYSPGNNNNPGNDWWRMTKEATLGTPAVPAVPGTPEVPAVYRTDIVVVTPEVPAVTCPEKPEPLVRVNIDSTLNCDTDVLTEVKTTITRNPVWNGESWEFGAEVTETETTERAATDQECPPVVTPEPPVVTPEPEILNPPVSKPPVVVVVPDVPADEVEELPKTGAAANGLMALAGLGMIAGGVTLRRKF